jgi:SAM-dependent methyltransferase
MTPEEMLRASGRRFGTCCSLYFQGLINRGSITPTCTYLELPPDLADSDRALEEYTQEDLWKLAAPNYSLLVHGQTGGEGCLLRDLVLDRFLDQLAKSPIVHGRNVLDVGCGEGRLLAKLRPQTRNVVGLELVEDVTPSLGVLDCIVRGSVYDAPRLLGRDKFDLAVMNLLVFWLADLDLALRSVSEVLAPGGQLVITTTPPEFTKNGDWVLTGGAYNWIVTVPLRRDRMLTMINRAVGPLWFYPRSSAEILDAAGKNGLRCSGAENLYLDSYLSREELSQVLLNHPSLRRHQMLPAFTTFTFIKCEVQLGGCTPAPFPDRASCGMEPLSVTAISEAQRKLS